MHQATVTLKSGAPYLVYIKKHNSCQEMQKVVKCHDVIKDWGTLVLEKTQGKQPMIFIHSYYLPKESRV